MSHRPFQNLTRENERSSFFKQRFVVAPRKLAPRLTKVLQATAAIG